MAAPGGPDGHDTGALTRLGHRGLPHRGDRRLEGRDQAGQLRGDTDRSAPLRLAAAGRQSAAELPEIAPAVEDLLDRALARSAGRLGKPERLKVVGEDTGPPDRAPVATESAVVAAVGGLGERRLGVVAPRREALDAGSRALPREPREAAAQAPHPPSIGRARQAPLGPLGELLPPGSEGRDRVRREEPESAHPLEEAQVDLKAARGGELAEEASGPAFHARTLEGLGRRADPLQGLAKVVDPVGRLSPDRAARLLDVAGALLPERRGLLHGRLL
jgi:hypothetical protein